MTLKSARGLGQVVVWRRDVNWPNYRLDVLDSKAACSQDRWLAVYQRQNRGFQAYGTWTTIQNPIDLVTKIFHHVGSSGWACTTKWIG